MNSPKKCKTVEQVFEARYSDGYRYLDRCGEAMSILLKTLPQTTKSIWMPEEAKPTGAALKCPVYDLTVKFDTTKLVVDQMFPETPLDLLPIASEVLQTIKGTFTFSDISRLGYRHIWLRPTDDVAKAESDSVKEAGLKIFTEDDLGQLEARRSDVMAKYETSDQSKGLCLRMAPRYNIDAPLTPDPRLHQPPHLLPTGQREALLAQLKQRQRQTESPMAGLVFDFDFWWAKRKEDDLRAFFQDAEETIEKLARKVAE